MLLAVLETVRIVAVMLSPITPALAQRVYLQLGFSEAEAGGLRWEHAQWGGKSCVCELCYWEPALFSAYLTCLKTLCQLSGCRAEGRTIHTQANPRLPAFGGRSCDSASSHSFCCMIQ